jgi:TPR repeat protein
MKRSLTTICVTLFILLGSAGMSGSTEPIKDYCLLGTKHSHSPIAGQCSDAYESGDYATALREWKPLAEKGLANAQYNLGQIYRRVQRAPQGYKTAVKWYRLAAKQGNAAAQSNLGWMYDLGKGVPKNYKTAVKWYRLAAKQGDAIAQSNLGTMYNNGQGVPKDYVRAHMWFNIAAKYGNNKNASGNRDIVAKQMTTSQLKTAQRLALECIRKKYKGC